MKPSPRMTNERNMISLPVSYDQVAQRGHGKSQLTDPAILIRKILPSGPSNYAQ